VSDREALERRYRRLLACYPRQFRRDNGDEILGVLLSAADDGQRVGIGEVVGLIRGALRAWSRLPRPCPRTVRAAVALMRAGAVLEVGYLATVIATESDVRSAILSRYPGLTPAQWHIIVLTHLLPDEVLAPVGVGIWLWMAWALGRGTYWSRVVLSALFGLATLGLLAALSQSAAVYAPADLLADVAMWLVQGAGVLLIFRKRSAPFFQPNPDARFFRVAGSPR
jgi:hypothetical protein